MKRLSLSPMSLGVKLSVLTSLSVALLLFVVLYAVESWWSDDQSKAVEQIAWARAQAESLTEYFIRIGRLNPADRLDGSWPVR